MRFINLTIPVMRGILREEQAIKPPQNSRVDNAYDIASRSFMHALCYEHPAVQHANRKRNIVQPLIHAAIVCAMKGNPSALHFISGKQPVRRNTAQILSRRKMENLFDVSPRYLALDQFAVFDVHTIYR